MTERKWTKGPWKRCGYTLICSDDMSVDICQVISNDIADGDEFSANANLLAQSPRLYDALEALVLAVKAGDAKEETLAVITAMQVMKDARGE